MEGGERPNYEEELVKKIFKDICGSSSRTAHIEKLQLIEYLTSNPRILKVLAI